MYIRNDSPHDEAGEKPHERHADAENESERPPFASDIFPGKLNSSEDELNAKDDASKMVCDEVKVFAGEVSIFEGTDEICNKGREYYAREGSDDYVISSLANQYYVYEVFLSLASNYSSYDSGGCLNVHASATKKVSVRSSETRPYNVISPPANVNTILKLFNAR